MNQKKLPSIKKDIKNFLNSEEGKITKKNSFKIGTTLGIIGIVLGNSVSAAPSCDHGSHSSCHSSHSSCCGDDDANYNTSNEGTYNPSYDGAEDGSQQFAVDAEFGAGDDGTFNANHDNPVCPTNHDSCHTSHSSHSSCCDLDHASCHSSCHASCVY